MENNYLKKVIGNRYEIQEIVGIGGMAVVYKAYDRQDDRTVAIKILKDEYLANEEFRMRFKNESQAIAMLSHPNIVKVYGVNFGINLQYIVMEYVEGITLKEYIERQHVVDRKEALHFIIQILRALQHAHDKGIVHRDVKPQNILLLPNATIKVTDFGIARFNRAESRNVVESSAIGSVHYISPEQARGEYTDGRSDIYSAGVVLYEMLTGKLPFESENDISVAIMHVRDEAVRPRELNPSIPEGLEQITLRAMQKNPADRYQSAAEFLSDLYAIKKDPDLTFDYDYFIDKDPTKYVSGLPKDADLIEAVTRETDPEVPDEQDDPEEEDLEKKNVTIPILIGVAVALVLAVALILGVAFAKPLKDLVGEKTGVVTETEGKSFWEKLDIFGLFSNDKIEVPNFLNMDYEEALQQYPNLAIDKPQYVYNTTYEAGRVCEQVPEAGAKVPKDTVIRLTVASVAEMVLIEDLKGKDKDDAKEILTAKGLVVELVPVLNANEKQNKVVFTQPSMNSYVERGGHVTVFYASDEASEEGVEVPSLIGYQLSVAKTKITAAGFKVGSIEYDSSSASQKDYVIRQNPAASELLPEGSEINLVIGNGVPQTGSTSVGIQLPSVSGEKGTLKSYLNGNLYETKSGVSLDGSSLSFGFTGTDANAKFQIYLEGTLLCEGTIDFTDDPPSVSAQRYSYSQKVRLPDVVGKVQDDAKHELGSAGFSNVVIKNQYSSSVEKGAVISQSPVSSDITQYSTSTVITLTVSLGPETSSETEAATQQPETEQGSAETPTEATTEEIQE
ncbi:MAG: Stk1 family PASTA domain-containing Ser/Thr kinase [Clostridia bacterium]|nr:Stk1 family PASTA domain-containing Ser/Thr kinase [Clostridia bacterium]